MTLYTFLFSDVLYEIRTNNSRIHSIRRFSSDDNIGIELDLNGVPDDVKPLILTTLNDTEQEADNNSELPSGHCW